MKPYCPVCDARLVLPCGNSDILIIGDAPEDQDIYAGHPFATSPKFMTSGKILRKELQREPIISTFSEYRVTNIWLHKPTKNEECYKFCYDAVLDEAKGKRAILLLGSDAVSTFTNYKVSDVSGLQVDSPILSAPLIMALVSPGLALHRGIGEVRQGIEKWKTALRKRKLI